MATLYVTLGISGCGKSTWTTKNGKGKIVINPDSIRKELTGSVSDQTRNAEVFSLAYRRTRDALHNGISVVFDSTALNSKTRKELLDIARQEKSNANLYVFEDSGFPTICRNRVIKDMHDEVDRADTTRQDIIDRQFQAYKAAMESIQTESWTSIEYV